MSSGPQDSSMEQRRAEHTSYQIFPEPSEQMKGAARLKERLPSIVVEPSEESGEQTSVADEEEEEEEDPFQDRSDPAGSGQEEQADVDGAPRFKRSSIPCIQIDYSRLTPPPSPTSSRAAPPRFRS